MLSGQVSRMRVFFFSWLEEWKITVSFPVPGISTCSSFFQVLYIYRLTNDGLFVNVILVSYILYAMFPNSTCRYIYTFPTAITCSFSSSHPLDPL